METSHNPTPLSWKTVLGIFTAVVFVFSSGWGVVNFAYNLGAKDKGADMQVQLNTQAKENLEYKIEALEKAEDTKHEQIINTLNTEIQALHSVIKQVEDNLKQLLEQAEAYSNDEDDGITNDWQAQVNNLEKQFKLEINHLKSLIK